MSVEAARPLAGPSDAKKTLPDGREVLSLDLTNLFRIRLGAGVDRFALAERLRTMPDVIFVEPNQRIVLLGIPSDSGFRNQWGMQNIGQAGGIPGADVDAVPAWDHTTGNPLIRIGIVDVGGVDATHPEFGGRVTGQVGTNIHATGVAGIAAATGNNGAGIAGMVWNNPIISETVDVLDGLTANAAIRAAVDAGCKVINCSWGMSFYSTVLGDALAYAHQHQVLVVAALSESGNLPWPNKLQNLGVMNVGATTNTDSPAGYMSPSPYVDVVAPGGTRGLVEAADIYSTLAPSGYYYDSGTSFAAPHVTGAAAQLLGSAFGQSGPLEAEDVRWIIRTTADDLPPDGFDNATGAGRLNARRMLEAADAGVIYLYQHGGGADQGASELYQMQIYNVPGLENGGYNVKLHEVRADFGPLGEGAVVWGLGSSTGWPGVGPNLPISERALFNTGWCEAVPNVSNPDGFTLHTYVYQVYYGPQNIYKGWYPCEPSQVVLRYRVWYPGETSGPASVVVSPTQSFFIPEAGSVTTPIVGSAATALFRTCPNNDIGSFVNSARIRLVLRDEQGVGIPDISPAEIFLLFNGGTAAQGFTGAGADSIIASSLMNYSPPCPDVRMVEADAPTDQNGVTYITFKGALASNPGVGVRDPSRKWGHFDSEIPVYARGVKLQGRLTEPDTTGSYVLRIRNIDVSGGLFANDFNFGEVVTGVDYSAIIGTGHLGHAVGTDYFDWFYDLSNNGTVDGADASTVLGHYYHSCAYPSNP